MRILLVEDEPDLGAIIERTLTREKYIVDWARDGEAAWDYLQSPWAQYTVLVVDWLLPKLSGLALCQRLRETNYTLPVLMLTAKDRVEDRVQGLDAGADDYLVKPFSNAELLARLRALQRRSPHLQSRRLTLGPLTLDYDSFTIRADNGTTATLTAKEFQLLEFLMQHPQQILSRDQILYQVWSMDADLKSNVVSAQMRLLRRKLIACGAEDLIETVHGLGYRLALGKVVNES
ncbi:two-component system response regulator RppA [Picosynechococcus sp. PCC 73109]|uniref:two-component system response regulator RppA n=1 Tax=Picosynechococcus sp. PCC 73109 TaxID=374982 RepID=UPI000745817F|nr:two-component system response regulator RppA [Picosynechococcus sp. PCC 73109]AMA10705.1 two-component system response regulator [Picosynechococcus sp. PCC 73109]MBV5260090.1 response regulator transcription factor [Synechococcus moorigangaii CMS01]